MSHSSHPQDQNLNPHPPSHPPPSQPPNGNLIPIEVPKNYEKMWAFFGDRGKFFDPTAPTPPRIMNPYSDAALNPGFQASDPSANLPPHALTHSAQVNHAQVRAQVQVQAQQVIGRVPGSGPSTPSSSSSTVRPKPPRPRLAFPIQQNGSHQGATFPGGSQQQSRPQNQPQPPAPAPAPSHLNALLDEVDPEQLDPDFVMFTQDPSNQITTTSKKPVLVKFPEIGDENAFKAQWGSASMTSSGRATGVASAVMCCALLAIYKALGQSRSFIPGGTVFKVSKQEERGSRRGRKRNVDEGSYK